MTGQNHPDYDARVELAARIAHETNRAWCEAHGDMSQFAWQNAPDWQKESARQGVRFLTQNPTANASSLHENWMKDKLADGWAYGETKDPDKKTHPCLVPHDELPEMQQQKDRLFYAVVMTVLSDPKETEPEEL